MGLGIVHVLGLNLERGSGTAADCALKSAHKRYRTVAMQTRL
ncbi:hypothetical protein X805_31610 [Sphaerotilus natans subsp. natans DSM 6575]|uniref:Uncharacterized protein n=1 Tax=Sphaerotilus natans subsp. natans DSM 6575 TaxID=1286631 RepID=A0A059KJ47_9BURK|nr:hypothetical protein X805_31610 [Sphaerotilus natans subsp. natans DSM 6575]